MAAAMALILLRSSVAGAAPVQPGSLAIIPPVTVEAEMEAAFNSAQGSVSLDPLLLVKGRDDVRALLERWRETGEAVTAAHVLAEGAVLEGADRLLQNAWESYYSFEFTDALDTLKRAENLLREPADGGHRARILFEICILRGMVRRAGGDSGFEGDFTRAVAVRPDRDLTPETYSPETIKLFRIVKKKVLAEESRAALESYGRPSDARVFVDGREVRESPGGRAALLPGIHYIDVLAPGYVPHREMVQTGGFEPVAIRYELDEAGPVGQPGEFFTLRARAGDRRYLSLLAGELGVDYVLIADPREDRLHAWLVDRDGETLVHQIIWEEGSSPDDAARSLRSILRPLRHGWESAGMADDMQMALPGVTAGPPGEPFQGRSGGKWGRIALLAGVLIAVGLAASSADDGGTRIEVTW